MKTFYRIFSTSASMPGATFCSKEISTQEEADRIRLKIPSFPSGSSDDQLIRYHFGSAVPSITGFNQGRTWVEACTTDK